ncbi:S9 family peptidase [Chryseobacterium sp. MDT2-18]|uniref:alpha/beta hydrolase family protein n=1 Tax=Chryseobacterium sp. MDT2-18 TaxID=1259136 RepID=UPI002783E930|nr:prolyl oligopeptidase family serine peptidase [Chryseobacterium sp. MDT2-18]MDQ0477090.1 dipeptidyl aminopeptidase/acylaminoacyl peptidase [Chryseobacterium sp. MDT2-18]
MRSLFLQLFLSLGIWFHADAQVQKSLDKRVGAKYHPKYQFYDLGHKSTSKNGDWITFYKNYDGNNDTLMIKNTQSNHAFTRVKTKEQVWIKDHCIAISTPEKTEVLNLKKKTSIMLPPADKMWLLPASKRLVLFHKNCLVLYDTTKNGLTEIGTDLEKVFVNEDKVYAVRKSDKAQSLYYLSGNTLVPMYRTDNSISNIQSLDSGAVLSFEKRDGKGKDLNFISLPDHKVFHLRDVIDFEPKSINVTSRKDGSLFLKVDVDIPERKKNEPEIWSTADQLLIEKFSKVKKRYFIWYPDQKKITELGDEKQNRIADIGNPNFLLAYSSSEFQNYTKRKVPSVIYRTDCRNKSLIPIDTVSGKIYGAPNGEMIMYQKDKVWKLVNLLTLKPTEITDKGFENPYFGNDGQIYFDGKSGIWRYDLEKNTMIAQYANQQKDLHYRILNASVKTIATGGSMEVAFHAPIVNLGNMLIETKNDGTQETSILLGIKNKVEVLKEPTTSKLVYLPELSAQMQFVFVEENYNLPKRFIKLEGCRKPKLVFQSNILDKDAAKIKVESIHYKNSKNIPLKGLLYYPLDFDASKKYPMVVHVYHDQSNKINIYPDLRYEESAVGFNIRSLLEKGYFVLMPDVIFDDRGTGLSSLDCINNALDVLQSHQSINSDQIALMGHSHGGYQTDFIATHSKRFKTYISGSGTADIVRSYYSFNYAFLSPFFWQFEEEQYEFNSSYSENKDLYLQNNPIHFVEQVSAPMLLWTGKKDQNVDWTQTMEFYMGLKRNQKKALALFYPDDPHSMISLESAKDLHQRILEWLDYYLKDETSDKGWISDKIL